MSQEYEWKVFNAIRSAALKRNVVVSWFGGQQSKVLDLVRQMKAEGKLFIHEIEAYNIHESVRKTSKVPGAMAEVGVYKGGSAWLINKANEKQKDVHLFDTFCGLPEPTRSDEPGFAGGQLVGTLEEVKAYLKSFDKVQYHVGLFPESAKGMEDVRFSFVNLDVDLFQSTWDCLDWFWPRMNKGGIIISHDYQNLAGVRKAFDLFFELKETPVIELPGCQCMVVKT